MGKNIWFLLQFLWRNTGLRYPTPFLLAGTIHCIWMAYAYLLFVFFIRSFIHLFVCCPWTLFENEVRSSVYLLAFGIRVLIFGKALKWEVWSLPFLCFVLAEPKANFTHFLFPQVCVSQFTVDGSWKYWSFMHHSQILCPPGLPLLRRKLDASNHLFWSSKTHQQWDGRQGPCKWAQCFSWRR